LDVKFNRLLQHSASASLFKMNIYIIALALLVFPVTPAKAAMDCWSYKITFSGGCHSDMCGMKCQNGSGGHSFHGMDCGADIFSGGDFDINVSEGCNGAFYGNLQEGDKLKAATIRGPEETTKTEATKEDSSLRKNGGN
jgi:hypothetical protein